MKGVQESFQVKMAAKILKHERAENFIFKIS